MQAPCTTALICGTGFGQWFAAADGEDLVQQTPLGPVALRRSRLGQVPVLGLQRHGPGHRYAPHEVPYRAHTAALAAAGARRVIATNAVGSLRVDVAPGSLVLIDDFIDFTHARDATYFGGPIPWPGGAVRHTDFTTPYCPALRHALMSAAAAQGVTVAPRGTYACMDGPRYESPAEVRMLARLGGDVVGMTGLPEAVLAREAGLCYAALCIVTNYGAGITREPIGHGLVSDAVRECAATVGRLLEAAVSLPADACDCAG